MMNTSLLTYRLFQPGDISGVLKLWKEDSGWGEITEEQFYKWYLNTPYGDCLTVVALDNNNEIVGQTVFMPSRIIINRKVKKSLRFIAPILSRNYTTKLTSQNHPLIEMFRLAVQIAVAENYSLIYAFPAFAWNRITKFFVSPDINPTPGLNSDFDCYSVSTQTAYETPKNLKSSIVERFDNDFDGLWLTATDCLPINSGVVRDQNWLNWKVGNRLTIETRDERNNLIGYVSIDKKTHLIIDLLAQTAEDLEIVIAATLNYLFTSEDISAIKFMNTPIISGIMKKFPLEKIDFKFLFWRYSLDKSLTPEELSISNWYLMPND